MLLLLFAGSGEIPDGFVVLPEVEHLYDPYKRYMASRSITVDPKDPSDILDYLIDYSPLLGSDTIDSSTWNVPAGITADSASATTTTTTVWVSGGTENQDYYIINRVVTTDGRQFERFLMVPVRQL